MNTNQDIVLITDNLLRLRDFNVISDREFVKKVESVVWDLDNEFHQNMFEKKKEEQSTLSPEVINAIMQKTGASKTQVINAMNQFNNDVCRVVLELDPNN